MIRKTLAALVLSAALSFAQSAPQFEVASIRPSAPLTPATASSVGLHMDRNQFRAGSLSLRDYIAMAYEVRPHQIEGPDWLTSERFDIQATIPADFTGSVLEPHVLAQFVRPLIEERFKLKSHRGSKEFAVYALTQTKDGIKAKESPQDEKTDSITVGGGATANGSQVSMGRGTGLSVTANHIEIKKMPMAAVAETLASFLDRPVIDQTGLASAYDLNIDLSPQDFQAMMIRAAMRNGIQVPAQAMTLIDTATLDSLHDALDKVGLKLDSRKQPLDVLIIDSAARQPTDN